MSSPNCRINLLHFEARALRMRTITRVIRPLKESQQMDGTWRAAPDLSRWVQLSSAGVPQQSITPSYGEPGTILVCSEWWAPSVKTPGKVLYRSDRHHASERVIWNPPSRLRPEDARFTMRVLDVSLKRLHDISDNEARETGAVFAEGLGWRHSFGQCRLTPRASFETAWQQEGARPSWSKNPWVWSIEVRPQRIKFPLNHHPIQRAHREA